MSESMSKRDVIDAVFDRTGLKKKDVEDMLDALVDIIVSNVTAGRTIKVPGLAKFERRYVKPRRVYLPNAQQNRTTPAKNAPKITPLAGFKRAVEVGAPVED